MKKYENFCKALKNLKEIRDYEEPYDNVTLTGLVGMYKICFEQAWKAMKEILEWHGFEEGKTGSPRQILKTAYAARMITDEDMWIEALQSRNNVAHAYNEKIALDIVRCAKKNYLELFEKLKVTIEEDWM